MVKKRISRDHSAAARRRRRSARPARARRHRAAPCSARGTDRPCRSARSRQSRPRPRNRPVGSIAPNRSAKTSESRCVQCSEPRPASMKVNSGRFERSASNSVSSTGSAMMTSARDAAGDQRRRGSRAGARRPARAEPVREHEAGQHIDLEQRDLIAPEHDQRGRRAGGRAPAPRRPIERAREQPAARSADRQG